MAHLMEMISKRIWSANAREMKALTMAGRKINQKITHWRQCRKYLKFALCRRVKHEAIIILPFVTFSTFRRMWANFDLPLLKH